MKKKDELTCFFCCKGGKLVVIRLSDDRVEYAHQTCYNKHRKEKK